MFNCGFVVKYEMSLGGGKYETRIDGPCSTVQEAQKMAEDLKTLDPCFKNPVVCQLVCNPNNPMLF